MIFQDILSSIGLIFLLLLSIEFSEYWKLIFQFISIQIIQLYVFSEFVQSSCITPDGRFGICVVVNECPYLLDMLRANDIYRSRDKTKFLLNSQCGQTSRLPKMCCASMSTLRKFHQKSTEHQKHCETANGGSGMCVDIGKCPILWEHSSQVNGYSCKTSSTTMKHVCCPKESITIGFPNFASLPVYPVTVSFGTMTSQPTSSTTPPTISPSTAMSSTAITTTIKTLTNSPTGLYLCF